MKTTDNGDGTFTHTLTPGDATSASIRALLIGTPPLVAVRCPQCGALLVRVSAGAAVEVKCLRCKTWISKDAA